MEAQNTAPSMSTPPMPQQEQKSSFLKKHKFTLISVVILILAIIPLIYLSRTYKKSPITTTQTTTNETISPTPSAQPLTQDNAQPTIDSADQQIQSALNQTQSELNSVNQINTSQDSTTGL